MRDVDVNVDVDADMDDCGTPTSCRPACRQVVLSVPASRLQV
jgi:hypothetical protein